MQFIRVMRLYKRCRASRSGENFNKMSRPVWSLWQVGDKELFNRKNPKKVFETVSRGYTVRVIGKQKG